MSGSELSGSDWWSSDSPDCIVAGRCVTDGLGDHDNHERCTIRPLRDLYISVRVFNTETGYDYLLHGRNGLTTANVVTAYTGRNHPHGLRLSTGMNDWLNWQTDQTVTFEGFTLCGSDSPPTSGPYTLPDPFVPPNTSPSPPPPPPSPRPPPSYRPPLQSSHRGVVWSSPLMYTVMPAVALLFIVVFIIMSKRRRRSARVNITWNHINRSTTTAGSTSSGPAARECRGVVAQAMPVTQAWSVQAAPLAPHPPMTAQAASVVSTTTTVTSHTSAPNMTVPMDTNGDGLTNVIAIGVPVDTSGDGRADSIAVDSTGDGRLDSIVQYQPQAQPPS